MKGNRTSRNRGTRRRGTRRRGTRRRASGRRGTRRRGTLLKRVLNKLFGGPKCVSTRKTITSNKLRGESQKLPVKTTPDFKDILKQGGRNKCMEKCMKYYWKGGYPPANSSYLDYNRNKSDKITKKCSELCPEKGGPTAPQYNRPGISNGCSYIDGRQLADPQHSPIFLKTRKGYFQILT